MAFSNSHCRGQIPLSCQLCEESNQIKWKCLQCDFLLCTKCQKLHNKVKSNDQHTIIDIKDIASQQAKDNKDFSNFPCEIHIGQNCCFFCQTCDEVVCPLCIAKTHTKHKMIELAEGYKLTLKKIKTFSSELVMKLSNYEKGRSTLSSFKSSEDFKYEIEKQIIMSREKVLKDEVEMHTKKLLKELDQRWDLLKQSVNDADNISQKINKDLEFRTESLTNALASVKTFDVFQAYKEEKAARNRSIEPVNARFKRLPQYVPGKLQIQQVLHGELTESDDDYQYALDQYEPKVIKHYKTGLKSIAQIVCCEDDGTLWMRDKNTKKIQKMKFSNGLVHIVQRLQFVTAGMALSLQGDLLFSIAEPNLTLLSHNTGEMIESKYSVAPLITGPIHITKEDKIIIRAGKKGPLFPVNGPRKVIVMDKDGTTEKVYDLDNNGKPIFSAPQRITTDSDNNIYVLDCLNKDWSGRIMALDKTNGVRWIYSGNQDINNAFKPRDLVATNLNNVIITDKDSHMIHILNTSGECIHYLNTRDQLSIVLPYSVDIDKTGTLYIGCFTRHGEPNEAKIYTVQISGF